MNTVTATKARSTFFKLLEKSNKEKLPFRITSKSGSTIMLSEDEYESLIETSELLAVGGLKKSIEEANENIKNNEMFSVDEVFNK